MRHATPAVAVAALTGLILMTGCRPRDRVAYEDLPPATRLTPDDLPPAVRMAFVRDYPDASITNISHLSAETGAPLYKVTFIDNRAAGSATYYVNGQRLTLPR